MKKAILICITAFLLNFFISCKGYDDCNCPSNKSPFWTDYTFTGVNASMYLKSISVYLKGESLAQLEPVRVEDEVVFNLTGVNELQACTCDWPLELSNYLDTLQQINVYRNSDSVLTDISDDVLIGSEKGDSTIYSIEDYLKLPTDSTWEGEQTFTIFSEQENLIHSHFSYRVMVKFSNNEEEYFVDL